MSEELVNGWRRQRKLLMDFLRNGDMISELDTVSLCQEVSRLSSRINTINEDDQRQEILEHVVEMPSKMNGKQVKERAKKQVPYVFSTWRTIR